MLFNQILARALIFIEALLVVSFILGKLVLASDFENRQSERLTQMTADIDSKHLKKNITKLWRSGQRQTLLNKLIYLLFTQPHLKNLDIPLFGNSNLCLYLKREFGVSLKNDGDTIYLCVQVNSPHGDFTYEYFLSEIKKEKLNHLLEYISQLYKTKSGIMFTLSPRVKYSIELSSNKSENEHVEKLEKLVAERLPIAQRLAFQNFTLPLPPAALSYNYRSLQALNRLALKLNLPSHRFPDRKLLEKQILPFLRRAQYSKDAIEAIDVLNLRTSRVIRNLRKICASRSASLVIKQKAKQVLSRWNQQSKNKRAALQEKIILINKKCKRFLKFRLPH